ncbi:MAG TPA: FHA domain-containing protein [Gemmatimonadaceae bacterium]|nr:FHA domain-containing protein [Gemmatimonadaceae bacterium]
MITVIILTLLVIGIVVAWVVSRRRRAAALRNREEIPLFTIPASQIPGLPRPSTATGRFATPTSSYEPPPVRSSPVDRDSRLAASAATVRTREGAVSAAARPARSETPVSIDDEMGEAVDGASVRFWRPADGTLQFLPGRLEIAAGRDAGQEIRFVRTGGPDGTCITFGRADGPPYRHVQLREPTVSRSHARMVLEQTGTGSRDGGSNQGRWRLENLSSTNPVVINGRSLDANGGAMASVMLSEGDRIEMGEVAFVFRER